MKSRIKTKLKEIEAISVSDIEGLEGELQMLAKKDLQGVTDKGYVTTNELIAKRFGFANGNVYVGREAGINKQLENPVQPGIYIGRRAGGLSAKTNMIAIGEYAFYGNQGSEDTIGIGNQPEQQSGVGYFKSILIGHGISGDQGVWINIIQIGHGANVSANNQVVIGNDEIEKTVLKGIVEAPLSTIEKIDRAGPKTLVNKEWVEERVQTQGNPIIPFIKDSGNTCKEMTDLGGLTRMIFSGGNPGGNASFCFMATQEDEGKEIMYTNPRSWDLPIDSSATNVQVIGSEINLTKLNKKSWYRMRIIDGIFKIVEYGDLPAEGGGAIQP